MLQITEKLRAAYPGARVGAILFKKVQVSEAGEADLRAIKKELEDNLRHKYGDLSRSDLILIEPLKSYVVYYKQFKKTYHVLLQLESVVSQNKSIPNINPLVLIMFMAELKNLLLTAAHDFDSISLPISVDLSKGSESYILLNAMEKELPPGDMVMEDKEGIISSIIYGPDYRSRISEETSSVLYTVYAPPGIEEAFIIEHLNDIRHYMSIASPHAKMEKMMVMI